MKTTISLFGISTCGTVRKARQWLDAQEIKYQWIDLRQAPPGLDQVTRWVAALGYKALRNTSGGAYRKLSDEKKTWREEQWIVAFAAEPMLIKRPVVEVEGRPVLVGFKQEDWTTVFKGIQA